MDGPFTDDMVRHFVMTLQTQDAIRKHGEAMAIFLAEAAIASQKARGDSALTALNKWSQVIKDRAAELIREKQRNSQVKVISAPDVIEGKSDG